MGLLAEKQSRSRISKDPNNTKWTRNTKSFGQKILRAQGWEPGQFLGAQNASHSTLHTAANASYIRVAVKDDIRGLGYSRAKEDEVTGLDVFSDLLSRLNGKSEESVERDGQARLAVKTNRYVEARWGPMRFVRGGLLVGDELRAESAEGESTPASEADEEPAESESTRRVKKSKKRKASDLAEGETEPASADAERTEGRRRKEERRARKLAAAAAAVPEAEDTATCEEGRSTKRFKGGRAKSKAGSEAEDESVDRKRSKKDKKDKKEKKKRRADKGGRADSNPNPNPTATSVSMSAPNTGTSTPVESGTGTSTPRGSRNLVRSRFIAQKKQAVLDTKALAQIFMVKT
ncbi:PinX1- protein [Metarhizium album ARSEF 1941]|uniref:PinX1-related protein 1 n=1 Tax=Metarhizium album (strain ARSEF 1941) TaxID=1081103 RepID=A0A0B2WN18_METAS|nr:PinX1- protein [Metarhizium album ARSEF 1941]KHN95308.1 PinX1- protein [Metarhizium album ARSEF 1941]